MSTSGTVGQTVVTVTDLIEDAYRACGVLASAISGEQQLTARRSLYTLCASLANRGLSLWCVSKQVLGTNQGDRVVNLPTGTVDLLDVLWRTQTILTGTTISGAGWQGIDLGAGGDQAVSNVAALLTNGATVSCVLESSPDAVTWTQQAATFPASQTVSANGWLTFDCDNSPTVRYWRLRNTAGAFPVVSVLRFGNNPYEVNMGRLNRDDYISFPNKTFTQPGARTPVFWFDKQITPRVWVWPACGDNTGQIVAMTHRQIQDVGVFTNTLEVPARWLDAIMFLLACRVAVKIPAAMLPVGRLEYLEQKAAEQLDWAEDGESDGSAIRLLPMIRGYTR